MKLKILFPNEPFTKNKVDSSYEDEFQSCKIMGIDTYFYDYDELVNDNKFISNIDGNDKCLLIYRGWMLKPEQYSFLYYKILERTNGYITLINSPEQYANCHCFPNIYYDIQKYTPKIITEKEINSSGLSRLYNKISFDFFIKDFVKSTKTNKGVEKLSKNILYFDLYRKIYDFIDERGSLFTGGIVLKEFVDLQKVLYKGDPHDNEWRAFYLYGNLLDLSNNSNIKISYASKNNNVPPKQLVAEVGIILSGKSNFFTVDFAQKTNGEWIILETGDGQVSGVSTDISALGFYNKLYHKYIQS